MAKYPGPILSSLTQVPYWYHCIRGDQIYWIHQLHQKYGPVVRVNPNELSYTDGRAWKDIFGHRVGGKPGNGKDTRWYSPPSATGGPTLQTEHDDAMHGRVRRIFANAFSHKALVEQEPLIRRYAELLVSKTREIVKSSSSAVDLVLLYNCTTFDIMGDLTFGEPLHLLEDSQLSPWIKAVFSNVKSLDMARVAREYTWLGPVWRRLIPRSLAESQKLHVQNSKDRVTRRLARARDDDHKDIWSLILRDGGKLDEARMHSNSTFFMLAGTETTATSLSGLTYNLLRNPDKMRKLVDEIRGAFSDPKDMNLVNLQQLPYLHACIEEGLRMYPPAPIGTPRKVAADGAAICGKWTRVYVHHYAAYRSPSNFRNPDAFVPERWMGAPEYESDKRDVFEPFSYGPRNCLGKNLAYHEIRLILSMMLWTYDMELCDDSLTWSDQKVWTLWDKPPLFVRLTREIGASGADAGATFLTVNFPSATSSYLTHLLPGENTVKREQGGGGR
ncbi:Cytochrome p450 protein [Lasiodiplodia theobromae]|uniref:Cytochrome p450 protein n=1 Tax=Lasiodiplodia theobromae TaxID=45133 RepID=UPI0015C3D55E|nr:Cytochrome p450 protein [Lasiodiplodia theobromae]KAF4540655.1 Cytochrome p450 protein [Lasiodiplodia theobromae]